LNAHVTEDRAADARRIVAANMYMTLATADAEGRPWVSPVWFAPAGDDAFLWVSRPERRHSRNIAVRAEVAIVIFDSTVPIGGAEALYAEAVAEQVPGDEVDAAIEVFSRRSEACGGGPFGRAEVEAPARLRLYRATASALSVLDANDDRLPLTPS
jgi:hypothetical protein